MTSKERSIICRPHEVLAILNGTQTQMRWVVKPQPTHFNPVGVPRLAQAVGNSKVIACPYGQPGERLWVRETFCDDWADSRGIQYRADGGLDGEMVDAGCRWRSSTQMPRAASRITLEVTGVRVERLQDISNEDIKAEGLDDDPRIVSGEIEGSMLTPFGRRIAFESLWEQINGPGSWDANPWVWVVEFRRITP